MLEKWHVHNLTQHRLLYVVTLLFSFPPEKCQYFVFTGTQFLSSIFLKFLTCLDSLEAIFPCLSS